MKKIWISVCWAMGLLLTACGGGGSSEQTSPVDEQGASASLDLQPVSVTRMESDMPDNWADGAVFVEIYVRGYKDSDGDGKGDLRGLTQQLDYLQQLGVEGIWLMPINASYDHDHGYAVTDYRAIEKDYGSQADFDAFIQAAHARGIGVIMDYVVNHSAITNPLFIDSDHSKAGKRDWYIWQSSNPGWRNWDGNPSWHKASNGYFYGVFWEKMPDFNLKNPDVLAYHHDSMRFWLNRGLDGFRFDAVGQLVENGPDSYESQPENRAILFDIQQLVTSDYQNRYMVCEEPADAVGAASSDSCGSAFAFGFNDAVRASVKSGGVSAQLRQVLQQMPLERMGIMLGNHDAFAGERLMDDFSGDQNLYRLAAATQLTMPGQPFIYYGEEIGMNHSAGNSGDWALRAPMSWSKAGGFTTGTPFRSPASNVTTFNVADQQADTASLWHFYRELIAARKEIPALRHGNLQLLRSDSVLAYTRTYQGQSVLVVLNYGVQATSVSVSLGKSLTQLTPVGKFAAGNVMTDSSGYVQLALDGQGIQIYQF
jgi:alpha-amylase